METTPKRLRRATANRGNLPLIGNAGPLLPRRRQPVIRRLRALRRLVWLAVFVPPAIALQALLMALPGTLNRGFARVFWGTVSRIRGLPIRVIGVKPATGGGRPVLYVCNHSSWLDIAALGARLEARFVAKSEVGVWPVIGTVARLGRTVFVSRARGEAGRERDRLRGALGAGDDLVLFPEGTSSDGARVLPFRSAFFDAAFDESRPVVQPVSVVYDRLAGLPVGHVSRAVFAWYGDMDLAPHVWRVAQWRGKRVTVLFHPPLDPAAFADRKALAQAAWRAVADGAAALRQNRLTAGAVVPSEATPHAEAVLA